MTESKFTISELIDIQKSFNTGFTSPEKISTVSEVGICPYKKYNFIGKPVFIRTVTLYYVGLLVDVTQIELVLTKASWIADTGRFSQAIVEGKLFEEIEPFIENDPIMVGRGAIIDCSIYKHTLPSKQK